MLYRYNQSGMLYILSVHHDGETTKKTRISTKGKSIIVDCPLEEMAHRWYNWQMKGEYIQVAFDNLSSDEREFILTSITQEEWDRMFPSEEKEES